MKIKTLPYPKIRAFTLVEILVVIGIIAILSGLVITALNPPQLRRAARDTNRQKDMAIISAGLEQYYADHNSYPNVTTIQCLREMMQGVNASDCTGTLPANSPVYIKTMPITQSTQASEYCYVRSPTTNPQNYILCAPTEAEKNVSPIIGACTPESPIPSGTFPTDYGSFCVENPF